jgi:hypothetical protein
MITLVFRDAAEASRGRLRPVGKVFGQILSMVWGSFLPLSVRAVTLESDSAERHQGTLFFEIQYLLQG